MNYTKLYHRLPLLLVILVSILLAGCTKEDRSDCPLPVSQLELSFYPTPSIEEGNDIQLDAIQSLDVYLFDKNGVFQTYYRDYDPKIADKDYRMIITARPNVYDLIVWSNIANADYSLDPLTFVEQETTITEAMMYLDKIENATVDRTISQLFYGKKLDTEVLPQADEGQTPQHIKIPLEQNTYTFDITIAEQPIEGKEFKIVIEAEHNGYDMYNIPILSRDFEYSKKTKAKGPGYKVQNAIIRTLNIFPNSQIQLKIYQWDGEQLLSESLIKLLETAAQNSGGNLNLNIKHNYKVIVSFGETEIDTSITIDGWSAFEEDSNLHPQS